MITIEEAYTNMCKGSLLTESRGGYNLNLESASLSEDATYRLSMVLDIDGVNTFEEVTEFYDFAIENDDDTVIRIATALIHNEVATAYDSNLPILAGQDADGSWPLAIYEYEIDSYRDDVDCRNILSKGEFQFVLEIDGFIDVANNSDSVIDVYKDQELLEKGLAQSLVKSNLSSLDLPDTVNIVGQTFYRQKHQIGQIDFTYDLPYQITVVYKTK